MIHGSSRYTIRDQANIRRRTMSRRRIVSFMIIVTTNDVPGYRITYTFGECFGLTVRSRNMDRILVPVSR